MEKKLTSAYSFCQFATSQGHDCHETSDYEETHPIDVALGDKLSSRYILRSELGQGAMGKVFLAYDTMLQRNVALKMALDARSRDSLVTSNALEEGQKAAMVNHPMIASVYDTGVHQGQPALSTQL